MNERITKEDLLSRIVYRDALILVLNKPAGIAVHRAGPMLYNLEQYFEHLRFGLKNGPYLAHRLDRDTSGCLVLARNTFAARLMHTLFTEKNIKKSYVAWVSGQVEKDNGLIDVPLKRQSNETNNWRMMAHDDGLKAITNYEVIHRNGTASLLKLMPHTGRTHQLRVHCQYLGHPIMGDKIYGHELDNGPLRLHAHSIEIPLYQKKPPKLVFSPLPQHVAELIPNGIMI
jgi:tRNA pseudouridine32 synthase / 23S rRNA pseudouridine746 synthase